MRGETLGLARAFGRAVRIRRQTLQLSQEELAWRAGLNRTYVTDVERGARNVSLGTMERLARALQTPVSLLLRDVEMARGTIPVSGPEDAAQDNLQHPK